MEAMELAGERFSDWYEAHNISRTTAFALLRAAGIEPGKKRIEGVNKPVSYLAGDQLRAMEALVEQHKAGRSVAELSTAIQKAVPERSELIATNSEPDDKAPGGDLLDRLRALKLAQSTGMVLTSKEARWILGKRPVANEKIQKVGLNAWLLSRD
jgi:hypothetical protein